MDDYKECIEESIRQCFDLHDKVIVLYENTLMEINLDKEDALKYDGYIEYSNNHGRINYHRYDFKEKILDANNNLILISDGETVTTSKITHGF